MEWNEEELKMHDEILKYFRLKMIEATLSGKEDKREIFEKYYRHELTRKPSEPIQMRLF